MVAALLAHQESHSDKEPFGVGVMCHGARQADSLKINRRSAAGSPPSVSLARCPWLRVRPRFAIVSLRTSGWARKIHVYRNSTEKFRAVEAFAWLAVFVDKGHA